MPNRIIKESICTSESLASLTWFEQCLFFRLICSADDYGVFDARPAIIRGRCFPLNDELSTQEIEIGLTNIAKSGMIELYKVEDRLFAQFTAWASHQQIRAKRAKFPLPADGIRCSSLISPDIKCNQMQSDAVLIQSKSKESNLKESNLKEKNTSKHTHSNTYGEYGWVKLSEAQYEKLKNDLGEDELKRCITYIDEAAQKTANKNHWRDWNLVIRSCSRGQWGKTGYTGYSRANKIVTAAQAEAERDIKVNMDDLAEMLNKV